MVRAVAMCWGRDTVTAALQKLDSTDAVPMDRQRKLGGGRSRLIDTDLTVQADLDGLINPVTRGDPDRSLRWTSKSTYKLAADLQEQGHQISARTRGLTVTQRGVPSPGAEQSA